MKEDYCYCNICGQPFDEDSWPNECCGHCPALDTICPLHKMVDLDKMLAKKYKELSELSKFVLYMESVRQRKQDELDAIKRERYGLN
jgi:hypothetical protein